MKVRTASLASLTGVAAIYFFAARLGYLFMSPGLPSPVWPASGMALAMVLLLGARVWPGLWAGAYLANLLGPFASDAVSGHMAGAAFGIATGNTIEALAGAWLVERFALGRDCFEHPKTVFRFL